MPLCGLEVTTPAPTRARITSRIVSRPLTSALASGPIGARRAVAGDRRWRRPGPRSRTRSGRRPACRASCPCSAAPAAAARKSYLTLVAAGTAGEDGAERWAALRARAPPPAGRPGPASCSRISFARPLARTGKLVASTWRTMPPLASMKSSVEVDVDRRAEVGAEVEVAGHHVDRRALRLGLAGFAWATPAKARGRQRRRPRAARWRSGGSVRFGAIKSRFLLGLPPPLPRRL